MAWIESHQELGRHPKTKRLARLLNISLPTAVGHLQFLWWWALDYAQDGCLGRFDAADIADAALWEGDPGTFIEALCEAGFLDRTDEGSLVIHDWNDYAGRLLEQREKQRRRRELYADMSLTRAVRARDGDRCRYCGKVVDWKDKKGENGGTYDHVDPDGPNTVDNIVVACRGCNSRKRNRTPEEAGISLLPVGYLPETCQKSAGDLPETCQNTAIPNQTKPNQTKPNQTEQNQTKPGDSPPPYPPLTNESEAENKADSNRTRRKRRDELSDPPKIKYAEFVSMTEQEYQNLVDRFGEDNAKRMIEVLDNYKGAHGKRYKSDYRAILTWVADRVLKEREPPVWTKREAVAGPVKSHAEPRRMPRAFESLMEWAEEDGPS